MMPRLTALETLPASVQRPGYRPENHGRGIVHLGLGAFHKAHQAVYTDDALAATGGDWRITGVSLRSTEAAAELTSQNGLYTLLQRGVAGTSARVIASLARALSLRLDRHDVLATLIDPATKIVSVTVTVTEKGYGFDRRTGGIDLSHPAIAADRQEPNHPQGVAGLITWALGQRRAAGRAPFTVLCCDNLPENGPMLRGLILDFATRTAPGLADHIAEQVAFPATMVDRITPARTDETLALAARLTGHTDAAAVETEVFSQWVVEDNFPTGRPVWEAGGAVFVANVTPYEAMKLRMLNGAHSMIAYAGFLSGHRCVRDVMCDANLSRLVRRHLAAARATLAPLPGVDLAVYADSLVARFENPHLEHKTYQIAMDGTEKLPQRLFDPACDALRNGQDISAFAFAVAAWMRFVSTPNVDGRPFDLRDPRQAELKRMTQGCNIAEAIFGALLDLDGLFPEMLRSSEGWRLAVVKKLAAMTELGMPGAIAVEAAALLRA